MRRSQLQIGVLAGLAACEVLACGSGSPDDGGANPIDVTAGLESSTGAEEDTSEGGDILLDLGDGPSMGDSGGECDALVESAEVQPVPQDILIFVDNSTSMAAEAGFVQEQLNAFSQQITDANVDARIMLFSSYPGFGNGICIEPPLGSGGCPANDHNPPNYLHFDGIMESAVFTYLLDRYPEYQPHLREGADTHIVAVADFDAGIEVADFLQQWGQLSPAAPDDFVFHGIIAPEDPGVACQMGTSCCEFADQRCARFQEIIAMTGGVEGNICDQEFQPIFDALAEQVVGDAELPCTFTLPLDAAGASFDQNEVNVEFDDGAGGVLELGRVDDASGCAGVSGGWYYDDPVEPTEILLCPQTCEAIQGFETASIAVLFGCATVPAE